MVLFERMRKGCCQSDEHWNCFKGNFGETSESWEPELNWTMAISLSRPIMASGLISSVTTSYFCAEWAQRLFWSVIPLSWSALRCSNQSYHCPGLRSGVLISPTTVLVCVKCLDQSYHCPSLRSDVQFGPATVLVCVQISPTTVLVCVQISPTTVHFWVLQYNFIAKCQYTDCTRNVLWCQVNSSHIHSNHKTFN